MEQDPRQSASAQNPVDLRLRTDGSTVRTSLQAGLLEPRPLAEMLSPQLITCYLGLPIRARPPS